MVKIISITAPKDDPMFTGKFVISSPPSKKGARSSNKNSPANTVGQKTKPSTPPTKRPPRRRRPTR